MAVKMEAHDAVVSDIVSQVRSFSERQQPFRIYHGSTNSTRPSQYRRDNIVDIRGLTHILEVNKEKKTVLTEPNVPMDNLINETIKYGLVPPVVMEFPGITAGGGFSGTSGESSSFRYGFFDRTVNWIEIVLGNGEKTIASQNHQSDLFWAAASSFGTIGVVTLLEIQLVQTKTYVELTYFRCDSLEEAIDQMKECTNDQSCEYLDGIVFARNWVVVCAGHLTDNPSSEARLQRFLRAKDPWFYLHAKKLTKNRSTPRIEVIPLVDYLFRYDRGGFWVGRYAFNYFIVPFDCFSRWLLDRLMHTRVLYHAMHKSGLAKENIVQDVALPYDATSEFIEWLHHNFGHYPLWICPLSQGGKGSDSPQSLFAEKANPNVPSPEFLMNIGIWGPGPINRKKFLEANRRLEQKVYDLHGKKWLYAHAYYTEEEFWNIYDRQKYDSLREKYHASYLPSIYQKVHVNLETDYCQSRGIRRFAGKIWPLRGWYGLYKAIRGGDYLLQKEMTLSK